MMKKLSVLLVAFCLLFLASTAAFAQTTAATKSWSNFWTRFSAAINNKDRTALRKLTASKADFNSGGGNETPDWWIAHIQKDNLWGEYRTSVATGTTAFRCARPCRTTKNEHLLFEFIGRRWQWTGIMGD